MKTINQIKQLIETIAPSANSTENRELFLNNYESSVIARKFKEFFDGERV